MREYSIEDNKYLIIKENKKFYKIDLDLLFPNLFITREEVKEELKGD